MLSTNHDKNRVYRSSVCRVCRRVRGSWRGPAERAETEDTRRHNPLLYIDKYMMKYGIVRRDSVVATLYATFAATHDRFRGGSGPRAGWSRRLSPDCQYLPIVPAADDG